MTANHLLWYLSDAISLSDEYGDGDGYGNGNGNGLSFGYNL